MRNKGRKLGECTCDYCGQLFQKPLSEIKRNSSLGRRNFCSRTCVGKNLNTLEFERFDLTKLGYKRYGDEYTKFRYHFRNIKQRHHDVDITIDDLKEQWDIQRGICEFSGVNLILSSYGKICENQIYTASVDRIDSNKGYIKGNIRWVSRSINYMKNNMSDDMVWELCNLIKENLLKKGSH